MTKSINFLKPSRRIGALRVISAAVTVSTVLQVSLIGAIVVPQQAAATGAVCPAGNVKFEVGGGYEYTDNTGTVSVVPAGSKNKATWASASGSLISAVCVKIGGSGGGSLLYPNPSLGMAGPFSYDISHVVLYTRPVSNQCTLYGIQDENTVDSLLYQVNLQTSVISQIGSIASGYDIEAMDAHPQTGVIYGLSGDQDDPPSKKKILVIDPTTGIPNLSSGIQLDLGSSQEIQGASFHPTTNELWVGGDGDFDLRTLNISTGVSTLKRSVSGSPEALAWKPDGGLLYFSIEDDLKTYHPSTNGVSTACSDVGGEIESLEYDDAGNLVMAMHGNSTLYRMNPQSCAKSPLYTTTYDDTETMTFGCAAQPQPTRLTIRKHVVGGPASAGDWTMHIGQVASFSGSEQGTTRDVTPGTYAISETGGPNGYVPSFSGDCDLKGDVTLVSGQQKTCLVTNTYTPTQTPNPPLGRSCGLDIALVVDRSGSVDRTEMAQQKDALSAFAGAFVGTPTVFSLTSFATSSTLEQGFSMSPVEAATAVTTDIPNSGDGNTNWDAGLARGFDSFDPRPAKANLVVIATDGSPNRRGYPTTVSESIQWNLGLTAAVDRANAVKAAGTRIVVVGVGEDAFDPATPAEKLDKMKSISGPVVALTPAEITVATDVIKVTDFSGIGSAMAAYANELCGGKILVQKQYDTNGDGQADLDGSIGDPRLAGWTFDVNGSPSNPSAQTTDATGALAFDVLNGEYHVVESTVQAGHALVAAECRQGDQAVGTVDLQTRTVSNLSVETDDTVSCTFLNAVTNGTLRVVKQVVGSARPSSDWQLHVKQNGADVLTSPQAGSASGTDYVLPAGSYVVSETGPGDFSLSFSESCFNGIAAVAAGQTTVCTLTNRFVPRYSIDFEKTGLTTVSPGNTMAYALAWSVAGNAPVTEAVITDPIPANTTFVSADQNATFANGTVTWSLGPKQPGDHGTVTVTVRVARPLPNGIELTNAACFDTAETPAACDTTITKVQSAPSISIAKSNNVATFIAPAAVVTYTVVVSNNASATANAENVVMTDTLPSGFTFVDGGATTKSFVLGSIAPGASATTTYTVNVAANQTAGVYTNSAIAKGSNTDQASASSKVEVRVPEVLALTAPELTIAKSVSRATAKPGDVVTYTIMVKNVGDGPATNVVVIDTLPKDLSFVDAKGRSYSWDLGTVAAGKVVTLSFDARVESDAKRGTYTNVAVVKADDVPEQEATADLKVERPEVKGLAITGSGAGDYLIFLAGGLLVALGVLGLRRHRVLATMSVPDRLD